MLTTGILSLNVHDSLTFEGTELCLNPDLFSIQHGLAKLTVSNGSAAAAAAISPIVSSDDHPQRGVGSSSTNSGNSGNTSQQSTNTPLAVGDMVEIRVWDPLPKEAAAAASKSPTSSGILRKSVLSRQSSQPPPLTPAISMYSPATTVGGSARSEGQTVSKGNINSNIINNIGIPSLLPRTEAFSESKESKKVDANSDSSPGFNGTGILQTSDVNSSNKQELNSKAIFPTVSFEDPPSPRATDEPVAVPTATNGNTTSAIPSLHHQQSLPPVFPRVRTGAGDHPSMPSTPISKPPKPSMIHRRAVSSASAIPVRSPKQQPHLQALPSKHVRDISDMTADTHQFDISGALINPTDSQDLVTGQDEMNESANEASLSKITSTHRLRLSFVLKATEKTFTSFKGNSRAQISMLRQVADLYNLSTYDLVTVHKIEPQDEEEVLKAVSADFVVVTIKDQFISRGDMLLFQTQLIGSWIYEGERLTESTRGIKAHAREIRHGNFSAKSGIVTDKTMITFRSRSARIVWLVQLSEEMWELSSPYEHQFEPESVCEVYFDKWIRFLYKLFRKWKELEVTHSLTVIFFSRTFLSNSQKSIINCHDAYGREFEDHYKPVIENESCLEWESLIVKIKEEFIRYPLEVGWNLNDRRPSSASQGNLLEAINVTLNLMQYHYLDRDLHRTGQSIVIVSPGAGVFEVDKGLASITYQRMLDNGIGSDMLSLGLPPLHIAPFFLYNNDYRSHEGLGIDSNEKNFEVPHYMHLSFVTYDRPEERRVYLSGLEDKHKPVQTNSWLDGFDVGPNGFLRPHHIHQVEPSANSEVKPHSPRSSFSLAGNKAATPGRASLVQERGQARQLISGRNFRDILEACRPRQLGASLPLPLQSLLSLKQCAVNKKIAKTMVSNLPKKEFAPDDIRLHEWGTVDFGDSMQLQTNPRSSRSPSPNTSIFKISGGDQATNKAQNNDSISPGSSFATSPLSSTYGTSFDRVFWDYYDSPKTPKRAFHMQRSPSFEFDVGSIDAERDTNEESLAASDNASKSSQGGESDTNTSQASKGDRHLDLLRHSMEGYDTKICKPQMICKPSVPRDKGVVSDPNGLNPNDNKLQGAVPKSQSRPEASNNRVLVGGLGAALSQYTTSTNDQGLLFADPTTNVMKRRSSGGNLYLSSQNRTTTFNNERKRAASPIFNSRFQQQERHIGSPKVFPSLISSMSTLLEPPDLHRTDRQNYSSINRPQPSRAVDMIGDQHKAPSTVTTPSVLRPSARGMPSSSVPHFESFGQKLLPISRSPPSNTGVFDLSSSVGGNNAPVPTKGFPRSPPKSGVSRERSVPVKSMALSPPKGSTLQRERSGPPRIGSRGSPHSSVKGTDGTRKQKAFNPFRQSDEDEVLAKRSHNRRRWSHVFPAGEVEFKRHAGPIWNSLTSPAILPLSVDYFPSPQELRDETRFQFNFYQVTLGGIENKHYATHSDLLMEMVRQRVTQDFQCVTPNAVEESERRAFDFLREARKGARTSRRPDPSPRPFSTISHDTPGTMKHYLSMGHRIQVLAYNPTSDAIEIIGYNRKSAQNDRENVYNYRFLLYSKVTEQYTKSVQTFKKYSEPYKWNRVDNLICGEEDRTMDVGMRFRRLMFGLIPEAFQTVDAEEEYVSKFQKLLSYLEKLREKDNSAPKIHVPIISSKNRIEEDNEDVAGTKARRDMTDSMIKFSVQLVRGKKDPFEWIEIAIDPTFDTMTSYRIMFNWLVASSAKVETQLQLLQRRCNQFGLKLISFPQTTVSWNLFLHALAVPTFLYIRDKGKAKMADVILKELDFIYDGNMVSSPQFLECIDNGKDFSFPRYRSGKVRSIPCQQFVHRSGALFIRKVTDRSGKVILVGIENYRHASNENMFRDITRKVVHELASKIKKIENTTD
ncbi:vacuolar membrane-associated protein [Nitzschia inconspicua]|uniref:Vacuolar membrane-associated protein n=1 Tax=Nitzschia inconspicua TaxID=303405 RepID=A0A9K3PJQ7_9STRA|nr:vacuolar membrane-associated protein [Nitzschia inconspicua]